MNALGPDGEAAMALIAARALRRNQDRAARLAGLIAGGIDEDDGATREEAITLAHQIAGSAGTFGHEAASDIARIVMTSLSQGLDPSSVEGLVAQVGALLDAPIDAPSELGDRQ